MTSLSNRVKSTAARAKRQGALISVSTETAIVDDRGIPFVVHVTPLQERKSRVRIDHDDDNFNPFLPPDPALLIGTVPPHHISVLNKFNVLDHHLLIVTRSFERQEALLTLDDFTALTTCMHEMDGLGFYNAGTVAGASQPHKHIQLVPLPLGAGPHPTPLDSVLVPSTERGIVTTVPVLPFAHSLITLDGSRLGAHRAAELHHLYRHACSAVGVHDDSRPYNLLLTRRWMLVVGRSREQWRGVSINALGFAGSLLVRNHDELNQLKETGPVAVLKSVVVDG